MDNDQEHMVRAVAREQTDPKHRTIFQIKGTFGGNLDVRLQFVCIPGRRIYLLKGHVAIAWDDLHQPISL